VTVAELRTLLAKLSDLLRASGAASTADDLASFCSDLKPHQSKTLSDLLNASPATPAPPRAPRAAKNEQQVNELFGRIIQLYDHASNPAVTIERIDEAFRELRRLNPTAARLDVLREPLRVTEKLKKADLIAKLRQAIVSRAGGAERLEM